MYVKSSAPTVKKKMETMCQFQKLFRDSCHCITHLTQKPNSKPKSHHSKTPRPHWLHEVNRRVGIDVGQQEWILVCHGKNEDPGAKLHI